MKTVTSRSVKRCSVWLAALMLGSAAVPQIANATIVQIETNMGMIEVNLFDNNTPATVANFLFYVQNGRYSSSIFHRSVPGFIVQGGGFFFDAALGFNSVPIEPPVVNEPAFSNLRGTIAMAKLGGDPNSATSQWFINLGNNSANLDAQNDGFTVFGQVTTDGMLVVDAIAALDLFNFANISSAFGEMPLQNFTGSSSADITESNLVFVSRITVIDTNADSAAGLNPVANNSNSGGGTDPAAPPADNGGGGGGGGGFGFLTLFALLLTWRYRQV